MLRTNAMKDAKDAKAGVGHTYAAPTPKVSRLKRGKVLSPAEKAAFIASRSDLAPKG